MFSLQPGVVLTFHKNKETTSLNIFSGRDTTLIYYAPSPSDVVKIPCKTQHIKLDSNPLYCALIYPSPSYYRH